MCDVTLAGNNRNARLYQMLSVGDLVPFVGSGWFFATRTKA